MMYLSLAPANHNNKKLTLQLKHIFECQKAVMATCHFHPPLPLKMLTHTQCNVQLDYHSGLNTLVGLFALSFGFWRKLIASVPTSLLIVHGSILATTTSHLARAFIKMVKLEAVCLEVEVGD